jgi:hypothetical protein
VRADRVRNEVEKAFQNGTKQTRQRVQEIV